MGGVSFAPVPGTAGRYVVDSEGAVYGPRGPLKSAPRRSLLTTRQQGHNHAGVTICYAAGKRTEWVHRLVYTAFHGPVPAGLLVRHRDGDPTNNRLDNLAVGTHADNMNDRDAHGTTAKGERHGCAKLTADQVGEIRKTYAAGGISQTALGAEYGVSQALVGYITRGEVWRDAA